MLIVKALPAIALACGIILAAVCALGLLAAVACIREWQAEEDERQGHYRSSGEAVMPMA